MKIYKMSKGRNASKKVGNHCCTELIYMDGFEVNFFVIYCGLCKREYILEQFLSPAIRKLVFA